MNHGTSGRGAMPRLGCLLLAVSLLAGCGAAPRAPIVDRQSPQRAKYAPVQRSPALRAAAAEIPSPPIHVVRRGDTLHAIAWRYRLDHRKLVAWNRLANPDLILVGQKIRLAPPPTASKQRKKSTDRTAAQPAKKREVREATAKPPAWGWPATGKATASKSVSGAKGIDIRGVRGQAIKSAAAGSVVYSGSGLRGYGELIIVKHNETYLSAYAHNEKRLVAEGERVTAGQKIATMGSTESRDVMLHFEIRRDGKTVDPFALLPKR